MKKIQLTQGLRAIVDDDIAKLIQDVPFHASSSRNKIYAKTNRSLLEGKVHTYLHWVVIQPSFRKDFQIKFKDGNTLNCQRDNLEYVEKTLNTQNNYKKKLSHKSKYLGVCIDISERRKHCKYISKVQYKGKKVFIGRYDSEKEAAIAYNNKAIELFGKKVKLNIL